MITAIEIPRTADGEGVRLCHRCQRRVYFAGGYLNIVVRALEAAAKVRQIAIWQQRRTAKAIEAGTVETERLDAKHESADPKGFAQGDQP